MLIHSIREVHLALHAIDFRKGINGLLAEAYALELNPYRGECVIFVHRNREKIKIIGGDERGVWMLERRFDAGRLELDFEFMRDPAINTISVAELSMILDGYDFIVTKKSKKYLT